MTSSSAKDYVDEIFSRTGIAISPDDPVMVVQVMLEKFFTDVFSEHQELYEDLKAHVSRLKVDADALDAGRRDKWLSEVGKVQDNFLSAFRLQTEASLREQRSCFDGIASDFSKKVGTTMRDASQAYAMNTKAIFWFTVGNMLALIVNFILFLRNS